MPMPSKYRPEFVEQAQKLCRLGATDEELAGFFEVGLTTLKDWKNKHPAFAAALVAAKQEADAKVVQSLYRRALGFSHDDVHISNHKGEITVTPIVKHYPPDTVACIFWLKNRQPDDWRDVKAVEHSGTVSHKHASDLSEADLERIAAGGSERAAEAEAGEGAAPGVH